MPKKTAKCECHGIQVDTSTAYCVKKNARNHYYCSEEDYIRISNRIKEREKVFQAVNDIFGYEVINKLLYKEISEISKVYDFPIISSYIQDNKEFISRYMDKYFINENAKINYFTAIIKSGIRDYSEKKKSTDIIKKGTEIPNNVSTYKPKQRRKSLDEYTDTGGLNE